jgi:hypothetical protein
LGAKLGSVSVTLGPKVLAATFELNSSMLPPPALCEARKTVSVVPCARLTPAIVSMVVSGGVHWPVNMFAASGFIS